MLRLSWVVAYITLTLFIIIVDMLVFMRVWFSIDIVLTLRPVITYVTLMLATVMAETCSS